MRNTKDAIIFKNWATRGFTIVELVVVIVVIGILATISVVGYGGWRTRTITNQLKSDLNGVVTAMENARNFGNGYPSTIPSTFMPSNGTVLQLAATSAGEFCINAYSLDSSNILMSYDSKIDMTMDSLCGGLPVGNPVGGIVPNTPRNVNIATDLSQWTLTGGATYNQTTKELILGGAGQAKSPKIRVDKPRMMYAGGDFYATVASAYSGWVSKGGWHISISYYAADAVTLVYNTSTPTPYQGNGCAISFTLSVWDLNDTRCAFNGGPNVVYTQYSFLGSNSGYASSDLKIKIPKLTIVD